MQEKIRGRINPEGSTSLEVRMKLKIFLNQTIAKSMPSTFILRKQNVILSLAAKFKIFWDVHFFCNFFITRSTIWIRLFYVKFTKTCLTDIWSSFEIPKHVWNFLTTAKFVLLSGFMCQYVFAGFFSFKFYLQAIGRNLKIRSKVCLAIWTTNILLYYKVGDINFVFPHRITIKGTKGRCQHSWNKNIIFKAL